MKKIVLTSVVLFLVGAVFAQDGNKAKEILEQVSAKTKTFKSLKASFVFAMENDEMDIHERNEGTILVKGQKYQVKLPDVGVEVYSDGTTIWNYMKDGNQVTISNIDSEGSELMDPSSIFSIYERGFRSEYQGEKKVAGKSVYQIKLFPDSDEYEVSEIEVAIDKQQMMISSAVLHGTDGNLYNIEVKNLKTNVDVADSEFQFDASKYPDVEEIDLR